MRNPKHRLAKTWRGRKLKIHDSNSIL